MKKQRKHYTPEEKVAILRRRLLEQVPLPNEVAYGIWNWEKLWKECGSTGGPGYDS